MISANDGKEIQQSNLVDTIPNNQTKPVEIEAELDQILRILSKVVFQETLLEALHTFEQKDLNFDLK